MTAPQQDGAAPAEPVLVSEQHGAVRVLRLNRPEARNALNPELIGALGSALVAAETDPDVRCVILTGTGDRAFCAGMDLRSFAAAGSPRLNAGEGAAGYARFTRGELGVPVVGAANATAVAGGFEVLLGCDVVVASDKAVFGLPEVKRGLFAAGGGVFISTRIPLAVALELTLTGDPIGADRALALGLVNIVVPAAEVMDAALRMADRIARNGPLALRATKELVRTASTDLAKAQELQATWQPRVFGSADAREGATAFIERRDPVWTGR
jgi:enoyl-CoA hydratase/carnithine racemase